MYGNVLGVSTTGAGALILPNTGGNSALTIAAYISIVVGVTIVLTSVARIIAKRSFKA